LLSSTPFLRSTPLLCSTPLILSTLLGAAILGCAGSDAALPGTRTDEPSGGPSRSDAGAPTAAVSTQGVPSIDASAPEVDVVPNVDVAAKTQPKSGPLAPNYVPGELVIKFKSESATAVIHDVASTLRNRRSFVDITADRSASLDTVFSRHGVLDAAGLLDRESLSTASAKAQLRSRVVAPFRLRAVNSGVGGVPPFARDLKPLEELVNVYRLQLPAGASLDAVMSDLRDDPHVEYVHPNYRAHLDYAPNDPYFSSSGSWGQPRADQWDIKKTRVPLAWDSARGAGVVVAVVDTGLDLTHPDIAGNVWTNTGEVPGNGVDDDSNGYVDDVNGWNTYFGSNEIFDQPGHGSHVAGTIAAQDNNGLGTVGVAPDAKIMPVQAFSAREVADVFTLSQGLVYATRNGADVINNSWSMCSDSCPSAPLVEDAVRAAHAAGAVVVFAAGNAAKDVRNFAPQNMPEVVVVAATTPNDTRASFSNFGVLDIAAPGSGDPNDPGIYEGKYGILSLRSAGCVETNAACSPELIVGDRYARMGGTSMAAPQVSGAAALILSLHPEYSQEQVRQVLRRTSVDVGTSGYDSDFGHGRLDTGTFATEPTPLEALIQMPQVINTNLVTINGRANGSQFSQYVLEYGVGGSPTTWTNLVTSTTPVTSGSIYFWKPTALPDGEYTFRLKATKTNGAGYEDRHRFTLDRIAIASPTTMAHVPGGDLSINGQAAPGNFKSYKLRVQTLETGAAVNANLVVPNNGVVPVMNGQLAVWKTQGLAPGHYKIFLDVTTTNNVVTTESVIVLVDPALHAGFPVDLVYGNKFVNTPARPLTTVDLQNDGRAEVIAGWGEQVTVLNGDGTVASGWPRTVATTDEPWNSLMSMPLAGDLDNDGQKEVIAASSAGSIYVWSAAGVLKPGWPKVVAPYASLSLSLADVDRNGRLDVVAADSQTGLYVFSSNGNSLAGWPVLVPNITGPATVADLNLDNRNEVIASVEGSPSQLYVWNASGVVQSGWPRTLLDGYPSVGGYPVVGDMDDDGDLEIVAVASDWVNTAQSRVVIYHHNGQLLKSFSPNATKVNPPVLADVDGDGSLEVVASIVKQDGTGALYVWDRNGTVLPQATPVGQTMSQLTFTTPIVADVDGDGRNEVVVSRQAEFFSEQLGLTYGYPVRVYAYNGASVTNLVRPAYGSWPNPDASLSLANIDGDAQLELLWTTVREGGSDTDVRWPRVQAWDLTTATTGAQAWTSYRADARHSGVASSVVPLVRLTQRNVPRRVTGTARYIVRTGGGGVMQVKHPQGAVVHYAVGTNLLKKTTLGWGDQFTVPANQDVKLRVVTTSAIDVTVDWW
jgi:subtilisin family serine protease